jgi:hypothetical protein
MEAPEATTTRTAGARSGVTTAVDVRLGAIEVVSNVDAGGFVIGWFGAFVTKDTVFEVMGGSSTKESAEL